MRHSKRIMPGSLPLKLGPKKILRLVTIAFHTLSIPRTFFCKHRPMSSRRVRAWLIRQQRYLRWETQIYVNSKTNMKQHMAQIKVVNIHQTFGDPYPIDRQSVPWGMD